MNRRIAAALSASLLMLAASLASAEGGAPTKDRTLRIKDPTHVGGYVQRPRAFFLLQRSNLNFAELQGPESFVPKVVKSADHSPF
jgi:hypothetical protein